MTAGDPAMAPRGARAGRPLGTLFVALVLAVVGACQTAPPGERYPELTYRHLPELRFEVGDLAIEQAYRPPLRPPNIEHLFPLAPADAAARWARDRLVPAGGSGRMRFIVREASVVEAPLEVKGGLEGLVTRDQSERYAARLAVEVEILDAAGRVEGRANAVAERSVTVPEGVSLAERERTWFQLTEALMSDLNRQLEETLRTAFFRYLVL